MADYSNDWSKEEYAEIHWESVKAFIEELEDDFRYSKHDKLLQLFGYMEAWKETDDNLRYEFYM